MGSETSEGLRREAFLACIGVILLVALAQAAGHLAYAFTDRPRTLLDVESSNGIPDLVSSGVFLVGALGALMLARLETPLRRPATVVAVLLGALGAADLVNDGTHPSTPGGFVIVVLAIATAVGLGAIARAAGRRTRVTLLVAACAVACSLVVSEIDAVHPWLVRKRGDPVKELRLVTKEGLELVGWSLAALALWDEALRRRRLQGATARASPAPAPSTPRGA